jgi:hypothetical protein
MVKHKQRTEQTRNKESAYPYYPFRACLKVAEAVKNCGGGRVDVAKDVLAHEMRMGESAPSFAQVIASAKCFGMIEGRGAYNMTEDAKCYFFPASETESEKAKLSFFGKPSSFRLLIGRFDGNRLPDAKTLANILLRDGRVPKSWISRVASLFVDAANDLGLIDDDGRLRYAVAMKKAGRSPPPGSPMGSEPATEEGQVRDKTVTDSFPTSREGIITEHVGAPNVILPAKQRTQEPPAESDATNRTNVWWFREAGGMVRVESPDPLPRVLWERLKRYVDVIEPAAEQEKEKPVGTQPVRE